MGSVTINELTDGVLDIERLLAPITDDAPCGRDLREDASPNSLYHTLRDIRTQARNNERSARADGETDFVQSTDWQPIVDQAPEILATQSKDLEIVAWLVEAFSRTRGFQGVAAGFALARALIERFGTDLYPQPDEDGKATQLAALIGLNGYGSEGALIPPLKAIPLTEGGPPAPFAAWQCEQAFELERITDPAKREERSKRGFVTRVELDRAMAETSQDFLQSTERHLRAALEIYQAFQETLDRYCEDDPQPTARIRETLDSCLQTLTYLAGDRLAARSDAVTNEEALSEADDLAEPPTEIAQIPANAAAQATLDRQRALRQLEEVAHYFRRTEPHSPVSYAIEQAVYWSKLSLPDLLNELIPDDGARQKFHQLAGIRVADP